MVSDISGEFIGTTPAPPSGDRVELTDLEVIQRWSLAVRGASADRADVVAALRADLAWLERGRARPRERTAEREATPRRVTSVASAPRTTTVTPRKTTVKKAAARKPAKTAKTAKTSRSSKSSASRSRAARGGTRRR